ncbi:MAG: alpha/beta hydrolase [Brooklawnia sp.]|jgi:acetyl esterase/lipase
MPQGYIIGVLINSIMVLAALAPPRRPRPLAVAAYMVGLPGNEIPVLLGLLVLAAFVDTLAGHGLPTTWSGWIWFVAGIAVLAGYNWLQVRSVRAHRVVEQAVGVQLPRPQLWRTIFPWPIQPRSVLRIANLAYGPGERQRLDVLRSRDARAPGPALIYWHGGGYSTGSKNFEARALRYRFAQLGWVVVSANYGLRPAAGYPGHLVDAKRVIAWVRGNAADHGIDPDRIVVAGSSAGAHLATLAALTPNQPSLQPGFTEANTTVAGAVGLYGYYGRYYGRTADEELPSTPLALPVDSAPPVLIAHGTNDTYVAVEKARALVAHLRSGSPAAVNYIELPGAQHGFDVLHSYRFDSVLSGIVAFCDHEIGRK